MRKFYVVAKFTCGWPSGMLKIFKLSFDCKRTLVTNEIYAILYVTNEIYHV